MMKNFKRILSMLLLLSMVLSMLPAMNLTASAATYSKATSIAVGDKVVFVCEDATVELSSISTTSTKYGIGTAYTSAPAGTMVFEVVEGYSSGTYAFKNGDNYLYWNSGNSLNVDATLSDKTSWTVSFTDGNAFVYNFGDTTRYIRWNSSSPRFACYTTEQTDIQIYKLDGSSGGSGSGDTGSGDTTGGSLSSGNYVIAAVVDGKYYAMSETIASGKFASKEVTVTGGKVSAADAAGYTYTLTASGSSYTISSSSTGKYLAYSSSANFKFADAAENWTVSAGEHGSYRVTNGTTTTRAIVYRAGTTLKFGAYATSNINGTEYYDIEFLPISGSGTVTPTSYAVSWSTSGEGSGTVTSSSGASGATVTSGTGVTMTITPDSGSTVESVTVNGTAQSVAESGGSITFTVSAATTVAIVWGKEAAVVGDVESGNYVIAVKIDGVYYAMSGLIDSKISRKPVTVTDGTVSLADAVGYTYTITAATDGYTIYNGEEYLKASSATSSNLAGSADPYYWNIAAGTNGTYRIASKTTTTKGLLHRASTDSTTYDVFGFYALSNISSASTTSYYDLELIPVSNAPGGSVDTFVKVESTDALGKGYYLIVQEDESLLFDASLATLNSTNNNQAVTIADKTIVTSLDYAFTIDTTAGFAASTIKSSGGYYIGRNNASAGLDASKTTAYTNTLSIDSNGNAVITGLGGYVLRFNTTSGQDRFRYYDGTQNAIALYKCTTSVPGTANVVVSWSTEGTGDGTITAKSADGASITSGASIPADTSVTMTITPDAGYSIASVSVNGVDYAIDAAGGDVTFTASENTTVVVTWEEIVLVSVDVDLKIISGAGKIEVYRDSEKIGSYEGVGGTSGKLSKPVYVGETVKLVVYPGEAQRLISVENGGRRIAKDELIWDATLGAYTCEVVIDKGSEAMRFSFLPRKTDIGVVAELATSFTPGKYVITGTTFDPTEGNTFNTNDTYLLFGCDDLLVSGATTIGDKAAALNLYDAGITIQPSAPYTMEGLTKGSLYDIQPYGDEGYYTMQICGMSSTYYLAAQDKNELRAVNTVDDYALWSISIDQNGVSTITNKSTGRVLKFNTVNENYQFRAYKTTLAGAYYLPVLYKATVTGYQVNYSKEGLGTVTVYNSTTSTSVASGSIQNENSVIVLSFAPAQYNSLESVTVNGVDYTDKVENGRLTLDPLTENLDIKVVFTNIVISNDITVNYYVNNDLMETVELTDLKVFTYMADLSRSVTIDGETYQYSALTFSYSHNVNTDAMFDKSDVLIPIDDGHVINLYFLLSPVILTKTAEEITKTSTSDTTLGGDDSASNFTDANNQDANGNVKQTYEITLNAQSSNWLDGYTTGGNTDIIVIIDNSLSMFDATEDGTNTAVINRTVLLNALKQFLDTVFIDKAANNRVALISYHTTAYLHNANKPAGYRKTATLNSAITYDNAFMAYGTGSGEVDIYDLAADAMNYDTVDASLSGYGGTTNPEAGLLLAQQVAALRPTDTERDLVVIMFTDGKPTSRLTDGYNYSYDKVGTSTYSGGSETSSREFNEARAAGVALKNYIKSYPNCDSTIYSVALLNALESTAARENYYYTMVKYLYGAGSAARQWVGSQDNSIVPAVGVSSNWKKVTGFSDVYKPIYTNKVNVQTELSGLFASIAYTVVPGKYVSIDGSIQDVIPPQFTLTAASKTALEAAGWTITTGANGTTISKASFPATYDGTSVTYEIEYQGGGYGSVFTNSSASFTYEDGKTKESVTANFFKPAVEVIPWTVDDHAVAELKTDTVIDLTGNDLFEELTAGGYTIKDYTITLTDKDGNPTSYYDAVEQHGCKFDAILDEDNGTVNFYTETDGSYTFYYVVSATLVQPDGTEEIVYSRVTPVDVVTPNAKLSKTAQEVTGNSAYSSYLVTDDFGNEQQLYLITRKVDKMNASDKIYNGVLTDVIPADFEFVKFVSPTSNTNLKHEDGVITWTNITAESTATNVVTLQFLLRYTGGGYGTAPTNTSANFSYNFGSSTGPETTQYFPVPTAGLNPGTVNDVDIAHSGDTNTLNVLDNDLFDEDGFQLPNYPASGVTVYITDAEGNIITDTDGNGSVEDEIFETYGMEITVNPDGTITYTAPETEGPVQFYYVVEANVTLPLDSTYAQDNSTTLISRPTMVTVYAITDKYLVVDFGYKTDALSLLPNSGIVIDTKTGTKLSDVITFATPNTGGAYGKAEYNTTANDVTFAFTPETMNFYATDHFATSLSTTKGTYVSVAREIASGVTVIPANNLFFEENFINYGTYTEAEGDGKTDENGGTWSNGAWVTEGEAANRTQGTANIVYGYDGAYKDGEDYSGGSTKAVTVTKNSYDEHGYFIFTGTGFDILASCSTDTGVLIAEVYAFDEEKEYSLGDLQRVVLIDTYFDGGEGVVFDQLPVIMCHDLPYGRYTVKLRAYYNEIFDHNYVAPQKSVVRKALGLSYDVPLEIQTLDPTKGVKTTRALPKAASGTYNVYVDSVRIYNPLNVVPTETIANQAYDDAGELNATFINIRDRILDAGNWTNGQDVVNGVLYIADQRVDDLIPTDPDNPDENRHEDDGSLPAPEVDGFYLSPTGSLKTVVEDGKTYLQGTDGKKLTYNNCSVYIVYIKKAETEGAADTVYYTVPEPVEVTDPDTGAVTRVPVTIDRIGYRYTDGNGVEQILTAKQRENLDFVHYTSRYEAFGPKFEVHLQNGGGIAFNIPSQAHAQISAKMADNGSAQLYAYYTKDGKLDWYPVATVTSRTEMYYDLTGCVYNGMLLVKCVTDEENKDAILSLCNLKVSGDSTEASPIVDEKTMVRAAFAFAGKGDVLEETETAVDENIIIGQQLLLDSDLTMTFRVKENLLSGYDMDSVYLVVERDIYPTDEEMYVSTKTLSDYELTDGTLVFTYSGITAAQMNDEIRVVLHIKDAEGNEYESAVMVTSIAAYAKGLLETYGADNSELCTLIMDMLNYGTAAQLHFNRHADAPANEAYPIFAEYASYASAGLNSALTDDAKVIENEGASASMTQTLDLNTRIGITYNVSLPEGVNAEDAVLVIKDADGNELETIELTSGTVDSKDRYVVNFAGNSARQMRRVVYATVYVNGAAISDTYAYSVCSYAHLAANYDGLPEAIVNLTKLMIIYGDSAAAYFG